MERDTQLSSNKLFHYTYSLENLINILKTGFQVQYSLESINFVSTQETNLQHEIAIPMICFCDIPLKLVKQHTAVYGNYAIGLAKEWGVGESVCPVLYLPEHGETTVIFEQIAENIQKNVSAIKGIKEIVPLEYK